MGNNKQIGKLGEDLATEYLQKQGYKILARNWGNKWGEIDIICSPCSQGERYYTPGVKGNLTPHQVCINQSPWGVLVFVEVKTKTGTMFGSPTQMVNPRKLLQIQRIASLYPAGINQPKRIDVIAIVLTRERKLLSLNHYQAVY